MTTAFVTVPRTDAERLAERVIEERLAACVNRIPIRSTYRWEGEIHHDEEELLLVKTSADGYERLCSRILELHPHETPCIERFDEDHVLEAYAEWRDGVVEG